MSLVKLNIARGVTGTLPTSNYVQGGITEADCWRITTDDTSSGNNYLTSNWERNDNSFTKIGTGLSESSGVFSFAVTGIYSITCKFSYQASGNDLTYAGGQLEATTNNSSYSSIAEGYNHIYNGLSGSAEYEDISFQTIFDVTDTSTHKFKIKITRSHSCLLFGHSTIQKTGFVCVRLGDT